jgi:aspartyl-tRNA(Asn)/glutamyl-tRNA(Gln) amidotransferase subunit B
MNSMRFIQMAIDYEARRQIGILEAGGEIVQETRLYDPDKNETRSMRSKEEAHDYRYFPDPDLLPLEIEQDWVDGIAASLPELPDEKKARFIADYGVTEYDASVLTADRDLADYFEASVGDNDGKRTANWVINEVLGRANKAEVSARDIAAPEVNIAILAMVGKDEISTKIAKDVLEIHIDTGRDPSEIVETEGMKQVSDTGAIEAAVDQIIVDNPAQVEKAKDNPKLAGWFVGQVMKATGGKANPKSVNEIVQAKLGL